MKKLLLCLGLFVSAFMISNKVNAKEIEQFCEYTEPCLTTEKIEELFVEANIDISVYDGYFIYAHRAVNYKYTGATVTMFVFKKSDLDSIYVRNLGEDDYYDDYYKFNFYLSNKSVYSISNSSYSSTIVDTEEPFYSSFYESYTYSQISFNSSYAYYTNVDILDVDGNVVFAKNSDDYEKKHIINFKLNGGYAIDSYQSNLEKKAIKQEMENAWTLYDTYKDSKSIMQEWNQLFLNPSLENFETFADTYVTIFNVDELKNIYMKIINKEYSQPITYTEDFSLNISTDIFEEYLTNLVIAKDNMQFYGLYYDENFTIKVTIDDVISSDVTLYAKFNYSSVDDLLNNVTFNKFTFDTNYEYAIISTGNSNSDVYLGLRKRLFNLEIYEYLDSSKEYIMGSTLCLVPDFLNNDVNYYRLDPLRTNNSNVIVLPRSKLEDFNNSVLTTYYDFYLSDNAYVRYTNSLSKTVIVDKNGNEIITDLQESYNYSQSALVKDEIKVGLNTFIKPINFIFSSITDFYNNYCPAVVQKFIYISFMLSIVLIVIRLIW